MASADDIALFDEGQDAIDAEDARQAAPARAAKGKASADDLAMFGEPAKDPRFVDSEPGVETRPLKNTGADLAGQMRSAAEAAGSPGRPTEDSDLTGQPEGMVGKYSPTTYGKAGNQFIGSPEEEATGFTQFAAGMALPGAAASGAGKVLDGAVARSAARAPGTLTAAAKEVGAAATSHAPAQIVVDMGLHAMGVPHGVATAAKMLPSAARAARLAGDEGLAAIGRTVNRFRPAVTAADADIVGAEATAPSVDVPLDVNPAGKWLGEGRAEPPAPPRLRLVPNDTRGIPSPVSPDVTTRIPRESMRDVVPPARGEGVDLAAEKVARARLPDDAAALDKTQRIETTAAAKDAHPYVQASLQRAMKALTPEQLKELAANADRSMEFGRRSSLREHFDQARLKDREIRSLANEEIGIKQKVLNSSSKNAALTDAAAIHDLPMARPMVVQPPGVRPDAFRAAMEESAKRAAAAEPSDRAIAKLIQGASKGGDPNELLREAETLGLSPYEATSILRRFAGARQ